MKKTLLITFLFTICLGFSQKVAFLGAEADVASLADDDAKAAATWMETTYGANFKYLQFSDITSQELSDVSVVVLYYLTSAEGTYSATPTDVTTMLPSELQSGTSQTNALIAWHKAGGGMLIAGDPTPFIFTLGRVPADFSAGDQPGNYRFKEVNNAGLETGKDPNDNWGIGVRAGATTNADQTGHPIYTGFDLSTGELFLQNASDREVRLIWWNVFDGIITPNCCGDNQTNINFENELKALKLGSLRNIGDTFGWGVVEFLPTTSGLDGDFNGDIATDFDGSIILLSNTIIGYEWDSENGNVNSINDRQANLETFTSNILNHLSGNSLSTNEFIAEELSLNLYPNPANDQIFIQTTYTDNLKANVYDISGRLVLSKEIVNGDFINISSLNSGLLFVEVKNSNNEAVKTLKVIKQ